MQDEESYGIAQIQGNCNVLWLLWIVQVNLGTKAMAMRCRCVG